MEYHVTDHQTVDHDIEVLDKIDISSIENSMKDKAVSSALQFSHVKIQGKLNS